MSSKGTMDHKCPNCAAVLKFNPHGQNWVCEYCKSKFTKQEVDDYEKIRGVEELTEDTEEVEEETNWEGASIYTCPNCGAEIVADETTSATFCVYCKNTAILKNKLVGKFNPSQIIPFHKTKEDAILAFKNLKKGRPLMPNFFNDSKNIEEIKGIYIPFWLYDYTISGDIVANANRVTTWRSGDYQYTRTDTYLVTRAGSMSFKRIPVDGSTHFNNDIMNSIEPFDYRGLSKFSHSYLSGFLAEKYNVDASEASKDASNRAKESTTDTLKSDIHGYTSVMVTNQNLNINNVNSNYVLLPVWLLNIKYKGKIRAFAMNGQTGKIIGDIPIDIKKAILYWIGIFLLTIIVIYIGWMIVGE